MSKKHFISAIQNRPWLIQEQYAYSAAPLIAKLLAGESVFEHDNDEEEEMQPGFFTITRDGAVSFGSKYNPFENAQPGSSAVISISGPIMKYDNCGDPGTRTYGNLITKANQNPNINSIILMIDSPGGTVDGTMDLATSVGASKKPVVSFVDGMMASAAYWIGSKASEIIANNVTSDIGSIGTMLRFIDVQPYWEKEGVKFHSVYADASTEKNKDFHDLQKGNYDSVKKDLNTINDQFIASVKASRPNIKATALTGKMFLAQEAIEQGLIDSIGSFSEAVERAQDLAKVTSSQTQTKKSQQTNMKKVNLTAAHAALLALCGISLAAGQDSVEVDIDAVNSAAAKAAQSLKAAQDEAAAKTKKAEDLEAEISAVETRATKAEKDLQDFKTANPGSTTTEKVGDDKLNNESADDFSSDIDARLKAIKSDIG